MKPKYLLIPLIVILAAYGIYSGRKDVDNVKRIKAGWEDKDLSILVSKCLTDSKQVAVDYPEETKEYCSCSGEQIQSHFTKEEFLQISKQSIDQQTRLLLPAFQTCLDDYQARLKKAGKSD
jgi:hypothetical protein